VEVARLLLGRNADPNTARTNDSAWTPLFVASLKDHSHVVQLLAVHGASLAQSNGDGSTAYDVATNMGHHPLAGWLAAAADHAPIQIAVGCRLHAEARAALRTGAMGDPTTCTVKQVMQAATGTPWCAGVAMPPVCRATAQLARDAMACWSPERHWLFHAGFRAAVHAVLLVRHRLEPEGAPEHQAPGTRQSHHLPRLPHLPLELWFSVCGQLLRRDWTRI
jgi:hypothetical protein